MKNWDFSIYFGPQPCRHTALGFPEPQSENWRNKTQTEMRDALKHPTVVTGYLEGNASSLICLVWFKTPNQTLNPQSLRKPTEFNSRWWKLYAIIKYRIISKKRRKKKTNSVAWRHLIDLVSVVVITLIVTTSKRKKNGAYQHFVGSQIAGLNKRAPMGLQLIFRFFFSRAGNVNLEMLLSAPNNVWS